MSNIVDVVDLAAEYLVVADVHAVSVGGGPEFWERLAADGELSEQTGRGWLVAVFDMDKTWSSWEMHPDGDEIVHVEHGRIRMTLELDNRSDTVELGAGNTVVVPAGAWHTVEVIEPARALHVTFGRGTRHRPR